MFLEPGLFESGGVGEAQAGAGENFSSVQRQQSQRHAGHAGIANTLL